MKIITLIALIFLSSCVGQETSRNKKSREDSLDQYETDGGSEVIEDQEDVAPLDIDYGATDLDVDHCQCVGILGDCECLEFQFAVDAYHLPNDFKDHPFGGDRG